MYLNGQNDLITIQESIRESCSRAVYSTVRSWLGKNIRPFGFK